MDFNELIEKEIESRVEERCKEYKKELEQKFEYLKKDLSEQYKSQTIKFLNSIKDKISDYSFEYISDKITNNEAKDIANTYFYNKKTDKCDFPNCKNYGNGTLDSICVDCDSHIIKKQKEEKCSKNLENSAANKINVKDYSKDEYAVKDSVDQLLNSDKINKTIDKLYSLFKEFFTYYGISKEDIKKKIVNINDLESKNGISINDLAYIFMVDNVNDFFENLKKNK